MVIRLKQNKIILRRLTKLNFLGGIPPKFEHFHIDINKNIVNMPQLFYMKLKICYDPWFLFFGVAMATWKQIARKKNLITLCSAAFVTILLCTLVQAYNFT